MNTIFDLTWITSSTLPGTLLLATIKGSLLLALAGILTYIMRRTSAAARHLIWTFGLASALLIPVLSAFLPTWEAPLLPAPDPVVEVASQQPTVRSTPVPQVAESDPDQTTPVLEGSDVDPVLSNPVVDLDAAWKANTPLQTTSNPVSPVLDPETGGASDSISITTWLFWIWALGFVLVGGRLLIGMFSIWWISRQARPVTDPVILPMFVDLCERLNLKRHVTLLRAQRAVPPMTWGAWHPVVVLPASSDDWTPARHRAVLMHELAHVKRYDWFTQTLAQLAAAIYWFNPLVWVAVRRLLNEQEVACDDQVLVAGANASDYAQSLLDVVRSLRSGEWSALATAAMARHSTLEGRLVAILDPNRSRQGLYALRVLVSTVLVCGMVIPLAAMQPWTSPAVADDAQQPERLVENNLVEHAGITSQAPTRLDINSSESEQPEGTEPLPEAPDRTDLIGISGGDAVESLPLSQSGQKQDSTKVLALIEALQDEDAEVRRVAVWALGDIEDPLAVPALMQVLTADPESDVRSKAAWALGEIESAESVDALAQALDDADDEVRRMAAWALGELENPRAVEPLMGLVRRTDIDAEVRASAVHALAEIEDPRAAGVFVEVLANDSSAELRRRAAWALGEIEVTEGVEPLIQALNDSDAEVRSMAVWSLGEIEDSRAVVPLTQLLQDSDPEVRRKVLWALGEMEDSRAVSGISTALQDDDAEVRSMAAWALGEMDGTEAVSALIEALQDPVEDVRLKAAWALGEIGDERAAESLMQVLQNDSSKEVRRQAARALADLD